jgi:hypothetical protein
MLNIFKKNEKLTEVPLDLKREEQRLLKELEEVRERMKFESVQNRNTDHIEQAFKDAGYEFSLSPHPAMWDKLYILSITNIETKRIITRTPYNADNLDAALNYLEQNLDVVIPLFKPNERFELDGMYLNSNHITVVREIDYNSLRNSWYGKCKVTIADNKAMISIELEHYVPMEDEVKFPNGVVRGMYTDAGHTPIVVYKIKQDGVETDNINDMLGDMYQTLCMTIEENEE